MVNARLLTAMTDCAWENLDCTKGTTGDQRSRKHTLPGWNDMVKPFQDFKHGAINMTTLKKMPTNMKPSDMKP